MDQARWSFLLHHLLFREVGIPQPQIGLLDALTVYSSDLHLVGKAPIFCTACSASHSSPRAHFALLRLRGEHHGPRDDSLRDALEMES